MASPTPIKYSNQYSPALLSHDPKYTISGLLISTFSLKSTKITVQILSHNIHLSTEHKATFLSFLATLPEKDIQEFRKEFMFSASTASSQSI